MRISYSCATARCLDVQSQSVFVFDLLLLYCTTAAQAELIHGYINTDRVALLHLVMPVQTDLKSGLQETEAATEAMSAQDLVRQGQVVATAQVKTA